MIINLISIFIGISAIIIDIPNMAVAHACFLIAISSVYFKKRVTTLCESGTFIVLVYMYFVDKLYDFTYFSMAVNCVFFVTLSLYFITKWGNDLIVEANNKEIDVTKILENLKNTMNTVGKNTNLLDTDISNSNSNLTVIHETSNSLSATVQEMTKGIMMQTESISKISEMMNQADTEVSEVSQFTKDLSQISKKPMILF
ncbi:hypothetical protein NNC19_13540 [Clostridium sp. SHJSY1]|nr:hypothetical protein [Clostridium sp. SHJSY1]